MKMSTLMTMLAALAAATIAAPVTAHADSPAPCSDGQVQVSNGGQQAASGHRELVLVFSLAPGAQECSLTGYPGVDSGAGGPLIHASRTMAGFMGGLRDTEAPPTVPPPHPLAPSSKVSPSTRPMPTARARNTPSFW